MANPLDTIEGIASANEWSFERADNFEITMLVGGKWCDYQISLTWMEDLEALHIASAFDLKVPERRRDEVQKLIAMINEQLWVGHFDLWTQDGMVMYRYSLLLSGGVHATDEQCKAMLDAGLSACESHFPTFQFVVWAGKSAREALTASMFETEGTA
jgi:hypothetical protein